MSLYHEAAALISAQSSISSDSLKSQIYGNKAHKSSPAQLYALVTEASKWNIVLKEVIERSGILGKERKLTPELALLLVHDLLLAKRGLTVPANHPLRAAVERHKARLQAEFTRVRVSRGCVSIDTLREFIGREQISATRKDGSRSAPNGELQLRQPHPRWLRVNRLKTTLEEQLATTFVDYRSASCLSEILLASTESSVSSPAKLYHVDSHIPDLLALPSTTPVSKFPAYLAGKLIAQDKASCIPVYLLNLCSEDGDILDACAAPGNKTTHIAALTFHGEASKQPTIYAIERNLDRVKTLHKMVATAGCKGRVRIFASTDFLTIKPEEKPWCEVGAIVLDPSCSGSGIVGRGEGEVNGFRKTWDMPIVEPTATRDKRKGNGKRKRKRDDEDASGLVNDDITLNGKGLELLTPENDSQLPNSTEDSKALEKRLSALSILQTKMLTHAFRFPRVKKITYSTCSLYDKENEKVVVSALLSTVAQERGWRVLRREEQVPGMKTWPTRGKLKACAGIDGAEVLANACIRCEKYTGEGTQGFFVVGFVREGGDILDGGLEEGEEWEGFGD